MNGSKLFWKLFLTHAVLMTVGMLALSVTNIYQRNAQTQVQFQRQVDAIGLLLRHELAHSWNTSDQTLQRIADRIYQETQFWATVLDTDGTVLAKSKPARGDAAGHKTKFVNPLQATDIQIAAKRSVGHARETVLGEQVQHTAFRIDRASNPLGFLRLSVPLATIASADEQHRSDTLSILTIVSLLAVAGTYWTAKHVVGPIGELTAAARQLSRGDRMQPISFQRDDELGTLADTLRNMDQQIRAREGEVRDTAELLSTVLEGMQEGVLAVDNEGKILFANPAARSILGGPSEKVAGKPLTEITRNPVLRLAVTRAMAVPTAAATSDPLKEETLEMVSEATPNKAYVLNASRLGGDPLPRRRHWISRRQ